MTDVPDEAERFLTEQPRIGHLATSHDNDPHVAPLWFNYHDGVIEITTTGRKLENIRQNSRVALSVQDDEGGHPQWGVSIQGTATVVEDEEEGTEMRHRINERYGADEDAFEENTPVRIDVGHVKHWTY